MVARVHGLRVLGERISYQLWSSAIRIFGSSKRVFRNIERSLASVVRLLRTASPEKGFLAGVFSSRNWRQLYALFRTFKARRNMKREDLAALGHGSSEKYLPALRFRASGMRLCARDPHLQASISCSCGCGSRNAAPQHDEKLGNSAAGLCFSHFSNASLDQTARTFRYGMMGDDAPNSTSLLLLSLPHPTGKKGIVTFLLNISASMTREWMSYRDFGALLSSVPSDLTQEEICTIKGMQVFPGMSKDALEYAVGFAEMEMIGRAPANSEFTSTVNRVFVWRAR